MAVTEIKLPDLGEGIDGGDILKVLVAVGDRIAAEQSIVEVETDKATIEVPSPLAGEVKRVAVAEGDHATTGQVLLEIEATAGGEEPAPAAPAREAAAAATPPTARPSTAASAPVPPPSRPAASAASQPGHVPAAAAPSVRRMAREIGVAIEEVHGTGPRGRISDEDVKAHAKRLLQGGGVRAGGGAATIQAPPLPDLSRWGGIRRQPMNRIRQVTASHLSTAWATIPHVTQHDEADVTELERFRQANARRAEKQGAKLTVTAMLLKVSAAALRAFPEFNSGIDVHAQEIVYRDYVHIGVAVDTPNGLLVPVLRDVDQKGILDLALEMGELASRARERKVTPDELQGGCFTITNLGGIGGTAFTPIVNAPEVAILGVSRTQTRPVWNGSAFEPRQMLPLSLSYDHRVIDGAAAARFVRWIAEGLEQPMSMFL